jgi:integrase
MTVDTTEQDKKVLLNLLEQVSEPTAKTYIKSRYEHGRKIATARTTMYALKAWHGFVGSKAIPNDATGLLEEFLNDSSLSPRSTHVYGAIIGKYLRKNGHTVKQIEHKVIDTEVEDVQNGTLTMEQARRIIQVLPLNVKVLAMMELCTLARPKELLQLTVSDIDFDSEPVMITIPSKISKNHNGRYTFLTSEVVEELKVFLADRLEHEDAPIFPNPRNHDAHTLESMYSKQFTYAISTKVTDLKGKIALYSFKKLGYSTIALTKGEFVAKKLKGDKFSNDMSSYGRIPNEKLKALYLEVEPELTLSNTEGIKKQTRTRIEELEQQIKTLTGDMENMKLVQDFAKALKSGKIKVDTLEHWKDTEGIIF